MKIQEFQYYISLGGGNHQLPLIRKAKELGYKVITVDKNESCPGFLESDIKIIESITEYRKVYNSLSQLMITGKIEGVFARSYGKSLYTSAYLAEKLKIPSSPKTSIEIFLDKKKAKAFLNTKGITTPKTIVIEKKTPRSKWKFPIIAKPAKGEAKRGVHLIHSLKELEEFRKGKKWKESEMIFEEWIDGPEITVMGFIQNSSIKNVFIIDKKTTEYPPFLEILHSLPSKLEILRGEILVILQNIIYYTNLSNSPFVAEFKVNKKGNIYLIEFCPEVGGEYLAESILQQHHSYDYFRDLVHLTTGKEISSFKPKKSLRKTAIYFTTPGASGSFEIRKKNDLERSKSIDKIFLRKEILKPGEKIHTDEGNHARAEVLGIERSTEQDFPFLETEWENYFTVEYERN